MSLGRLCHFVLENAKSESPHQKIFICCSYEYLDQYLLENVCLIESTFNKGKVLFVTGVAKDIFFTFLERGSLQSCT